MPENKNKIDKRDKKILYLNIVMLFVFIVGVVLIMLGFLDASDAHQVRHRMMMGIGWSIVSASIAYWHVETRWLFKLKHNIKWGKDELPKGE